MLESFQVGYCNGTLKSALPSSGEILSQLQSLGVLNAKGNEVFYGRIVVPIVDAAGVAVGLYGRKVEGSGSGIKLPAEAAAHIYLAGGHKAALNAAAVRRAGRIIFVEAILDALSIWQAGERAVVPLYGADGFTSHHEKLVREAQATEIILALDNDQAGREGTRRLRAKLLELLAGRTPAVAVRVLAWPEGVKDASAYFSTSSRPSSEFSSLIAAAQPRADAKREAGPDTAGKEEMIEPRENGFALKFPGRRYEVMAVERVGTARLKATVKALGVEPGRFHVETLDLCSARARRLFAAEVARLLRLPAEVTEPDLAKILLAAEQHAGSGPSSADKKPAAVTVSEAEKAEGEKFGRSGDLLGELQSDLGKLGLVGEETNRLLLYLALTSRKMDDPLAVQILSSSGAGKSHLQDAVLSLCPDEDLIKLTALTGQALFYKGEDALRHKCLALEEVAGAQGARYAVRNLISAKKLTIEATIKNPLTGKMETQVNTAYGPTAVFETTTQPDTDPETKSRYLVIAVDESPEQTRAIVAAQRQRHTIGALVARKEREAVLRRHHAFQRLLRPLPVVNPYEPLLTYGDLRLTTRRDFPKYLNLILAAAFLHQMQRPVKSHPVLGDYIEATLEDVASANELAAELFGASADELSSPSRRLAGLIAGQVETWAAEQKRGWEKVEWTRRALREVLQWSEARLRLHLDELVRLEYVQVLCGGYGSVFRYRLLVSPEAIRAGSRTVLGIRPIGEVRQAASLAGIGANLAGIGGNLAGQNGNLAGQNGHLAGVSANLAGTSQPPFARLDCNTTPSPSVGRVPIAADLAGVGREPIPAFVNGAS